VGKEGKEGTEKKEREKKIIMERKESERRVS
jgi:hypothetical protein